MANGRSLFYRKAAALTIPLLAYFIASILQSQTWGDILSPINALAASGILFYAFFRLNDHKLARISMLLNSVACLAWGVADLVWAVQAFGGMQPVENPVLWVLYALTNLFLIMAFLLIAAVQFSKWNSIQMAVDLIVTALSCGAFLWIVFFNRDWLLFDQLMRMDFTSLASITMDVILATGIFVWFLAIRTGNVPRYLRLMAAGATLFALSDLFYYYTCFKGLYMPNSLSDFFYIFSLYLIALGGLRKTCVHKVPMDLKKITNVGLGNKWAYLLVFPVVVFMLEAVNLIDTNLAIMDYLFFAVLIFLHWSFSRYIQISIENERLLGLEKLNNEMLEQRIAEQVQELVYLANQDTLTSLSNRRYFMGALNESIRRGRPNETLALMMLDMDRFKTINDSFGHDTGDKVLIEFANRVTEWNRFGATIARLGGDEFGFIFSGCFTLEELSGFCRQITEICNKPIVIGGNSIDITASIGVAVLSADASDGKTLMKNADIAMYQAKAQGYNKYQFFDPVFGENAVNSSKIELLLKQVDVEKEFELYYQPQFSLPDKELVGAEALIRWKSASNGYIPPNAFIPVAEKIEYIAKIGKWVLKESVRQAVAWNEKLGRPIKIGINISPRQLNDDTFLDILRMLIRETGVDAAWLDVEITESTMISQTGKVNNVFDMLKGLGVSVSIDDFGSGYSAMGYLNKYPFDRIKIDKSLIDNILPYNIGGVSIVKSIIGMSKSLGIISIAEGVETEEQLDVLINLGCDQVQGYLLGRPVPAKDFERLFMKWGKSGSGFESQG